MDRAGIQWEWARSEQTNLERLPGDLRKIIRGVDFVVGVLFGGAPDANTMFEIGVAIGIGKPVLLILATEARLPYNLEVFPHLRTSLADEKAIALHLDLLMRSASRRPRYPSSVRARPRLPSFSSVPSLNLVKRRPESALEAETVSLIEQAGGQVLLHPRLDESTPSYRPDLLFWLTLGDAELLNPAVVELKGGTVIPSNLNEVADQLFVFLQNTGVRTGLVVVQGLGPHLPASFRSSPSQTVFFLDYDTFRQLLKSGKLADHLRRERNRAVHGLR